MVIKHIVRADIQTLTNEYIENCGKLFLTNIFTYLNISSLLCEAVVIWAVANAEIKAYIRGKYYGSGRFKSRSPSLLDCSANTELARGDI